MLLRAALSIGLAVPAGAQIVTENAGVLSPQTPELREVFWFTEAASGRDLVWATQAIVSTDIANEFKFTLPWIWRSVERSAGDLDLSGLGDVSVRWKHALYRDDDVMRSTRWASLVELAAPTGDSDEFDDGVAIPPDLRLSRGDWSFGAGAAFTTIDDRHRFAVDAMYRHRTSHDGFQLGDSVDLDLAYWYRLAPARFDDLETTTEVRGVVELLSSYRWDNEESGEIADGGGSLVWFAPGLQVFPLDWFLLEANVLVPVAQTIDDAFGDRHVGGILSLKFLF